jgi:AhpD family alkylhydroperoxidase
MKRAFKKTVIFIAVFIVGLAGAIQAADRPTQEQTLAEIEKDFGFVPNLLREMSKSPAAPLVYTKTEAIMHNAYLTQQEQQVVQLVVSLFNECHYCSSMHSKFSEVNGVSHDDVLAIRNGEKPKDQHIADLVWTTNTILEKRGHLSEADLEKIEKMGIDSARLYEILAHIGRKMIANYAVHIINPELDDVFKFEE